MNKQQQEPMIVEVRATPAHGHTYRWCGKERWVADPLKRRPVEMEELPTGGLKPVYDANGDYVPARMSLPWTASAVKVKVVENPAPFNPEHGAPTEISPATLAMLEKDRYIHVRALNVDGTNPTELMATKGQMIELEDKLKHAQLQLAQMQEEKRLNSDERMARAASEITKLRQELAEAQAQLAKRK